MWNGICTIKNINRLKAIPEITIFPPGRHFAPQPSSNNLTHPK